LWIGETDVLSFKFLDARESFSGAGIAGYDYGLLLAFSIRIWLECRRLRLGKYMCLLREAEPAVA